MDISGGRVRRLTHGPLGLPGPAGVEEHGQWPRGFPRNLGGPAVSIDNSGSGDRNRPTPRPPVGTSTAEGSETRAQRWYRQAKATKRGETDGRESERPIVPMKRGNRPEGPRGGKGTPCHDTVGGKHGGCIETRGRVHETTTDSGTRSAKSRRWGSRPWPTSSTSTGCTRRTSGPARTGPWAWTDRRRGLRGGPGGQPPVAAGPSQVRHVPGAAGAAGAHPEGRLGDRDPTARDSDLRGQGASAGGRHGAGSRSTSRTFWTARTASGPGGRRTRRWRPCGSRRWRWEAAGSWRWTSESSSMMAS